MSAQKLPVELDCLSSTFVCSVFIFFGIFSYSGIFRSGLSFICCVVVWCCLLASCPCLCHSFMLHWVSTLWFCFVIPPPVCFLGMTLTLTCFLNPYKTAVQSFANWRRIRGRVGNSKSSHTDTRHMVFNSWLKDGVKLNSNNNNNAGHTTQDKNLSCFVQPYKKVSDAEPSSLIIKETRRLMDG